MNANAISWVFVLLVLAVASPLQGWAQSRPAAPAPTASAGDREITVLNRTSNTVNELYVSPSAAEQWGDDRLGDDTLDPGKSLRVRLGRLRDCEFDVQVVYEDGSHEESRKLNLCRVKQVTFDGSTAVAAVKPATGGEHVVTLLNNAGRPIQQVFISPADASQWGDDRLTDDSLSVGESTKLTYRGDCAADMRVVFDNKAAEERRGLDLCATPIVSIEPGWTTADTVPTGTVLAPATGAVSPPPANPRATAPPVASPPAQPTVPPAPAVPGAARPGKNPVLVTNQSGHAAVELYIYPAGTAARGQDRLGAGELKDGGTLSVTFDRGSVCRFDVHVVYGGKTADGDQRGLDLCTSPGIVLRP